MRLLTVLALACFVAASAWADEDTKKAAEGLQGEWKFLSFTKLNRDNPEIVENGKIAIAGDKLTFRVGDSANILVFTLVPNSDPPAIDMRAEGDKKVIRGIYKLEKDKLTICFGIENSARPTEFKSGRDDSVMVLERIKK